MLSYSTRNALLCMMMTFSIKFTSDMTTMALLDMVSRNDTKIGFADTASSLQNHTCPVTEQVLVAQEVRIATNSTKMNWSENQIGKVQGVYFYGYVATMVIGVDYLLVFTGSYLAVVLIGVVSAMMTVFFPFLVLQFGYNGALAGRLLLGLVQGPATSLLAVTVKEWSTVANLTFTVTLCTLGSGLSSAAILLVDGNAIGRGIGWIELYKFHGLVSLVLTLVFMYFGDNGPNGSGFWFDRYRPFRLSKTTGRSDEKEGFVSVVRSRQRVPWRRLLVSRDVQIVGMTWFFFQSACKSCFLFSKEKPSVIQTRPW